MERKFIPYATYQLIVLIKAIYFRRIRDLREITFVSIFDYTCTHKFAGLMHRIGINDHKSIHNTRHPSEHTHTHTHTTIFASKTITHVRNYQNSNYAIVCIFKKCSCVAKWPVRNVQHTNLIRKLNTCAVGWILLHERQEVRTVFFLLFLLFHVPMRLTTISSHLKFSFWLLLLLLL